MVAASRRRRGFTVAELIITTALLSAVLTATWVLMVAGTRGQRAARDQVELYSAVRSAMRTIGLMVRRAEGVLGTSTGPQASYASTAHQLGLSVPSTGSAAQRVAVRYYLQDNILYEQTGTLEAAPLLSTVSRFEVAYFSPAGGNQLVSASRPEDASGIQVTLTAARGSARATLNSYFALRTGELP